MASLNDTTAYASTAAANPGLATVADLAATAGFQGNAATLRAASSLTARDGAYYNRALNTVVIYQAGVTLDGVDFRGANVLVQADNVTIRNALFDARTGMAAVTAAATTSGLTIDHSTFDGLKLDRNYADFVASFGRNTTLTNNAFLNAPSDAIYIENGRVANNYIAGGGYRTGAHADGIWVGRTTGAVTIEGNLIDWRSSADARVATNNAVRITAENGNTANVQVRGNVLLGGSYTVSVTEIVGDRGTISGVSVTGNVIDGSQWGGLYIKDQPAGLVYAGNVAATGPAQTFGAAALGLSVASLVAGATLIAGTAGADALAAGAGRQFIQGGAGQDWISAGAGADVIEGGAGRDYLTGGQGADVFLYRSLDSGRDLITDFTDGEDRIDLAELPGAPAAPSDWNRVGTGRFNGQAWELRSEALANGNTLLQLDRDGDQRADLEIEVQGRHSFDAADFILGTQAGGSPTASLPLVQGTAGNDVIVGTDAAERIEAGAGNDSIRTGAGDDVIVGGAGKDVIVTGGGRDRLVYEAVGDSLPGSRDYVTDFMVGSDVIDLSMIDANAGTARDDAFSWIGDAAFSGQAGELRFSATSAGSILVQADVNGDRVADFAIELAGTQRLTASDFVL